MTAEYVDNARLDRLVREYGDMVYRLAIIRCHSKEDAEDVFQDVFVKLVRNIGKLNTDEHVKAWLIRVTINQCNSLYASSWNKKTQSYEEMVENGAVPDAAAPEEEPLDEVYEAVRSLQPEYRDVIYLFYYEELSIKQIGQILNLSEGNVKVRLNRARKKLKVMLEKEGVQ